LINGSNNIIIIIIRFVLGNMNNFRMETKHNTQTFIYDMWDSKVINRNNEVTFTFDMKSCHFIRNQIDQKMGWRRCKTTMFCMKIDDK
jgi:hypothetical protein